MNQGHGRRLSWMAGAGGGLGAILGAAISDIVMAGGMAQLLVGLCAGAGGVIGHQVGRATGKG